MARQTKLATGDATDESPDILAAGDSDGVTGAEAARQKSDYARMRDILAKQPKVRVRLAEDTFAQLNGYTFSIKGGQSVLVPEQVYELLLKAGRV